MSRYPLLVSSTCWQTDRENIPTTISTSPRKCDQRLNARLMLGFHGFCFFPIPSQAERWRWNPESHFSCGVTVAMGKELREWHKPPASSRSSNRCLLLVLELLQWPELFCCERHRALCSSSLSKHPRRSTMPQVAIRENSDRLQDTSPCFPSSLWSSFNTHTHTDRDYLGGRPFNWPTAAQCDMQSPLTQYYPNPLRSANFYQTSNVTICSVAANLKVEAQTFVVLWVHITAIING